MWISIALLTTSTIPGIFAILENYIRHLKSAASARVGLIQKA